MQKNINNLFDLVFLILRYKMEFKLHLKIVIDLLA